MRSFDPEDVMDVELTESERHLLARGLVEWYGPARCTEEFAVAMGFGGLEKFKAEIDVLIDALQRKLAMTRFDWARALLAVEIVFASDVIGSGSDWAVTTGIEESTALETLRAVQGKLSKETRCLIGAGLGTLVSVTEEEADDSDGAEDGLGDGANGVAADLLDVELTELERKMLLQGLKEWFGPATCTEEFAIALGFKGQEEFAEGVESFWQAVEAGEPRNRLDWARALLAVEIVFASDVIRSGDGWSISTGVEDELALRVLRGLQLKLVGETRRLLGAGLGTRPPVALENLLEKDD